MTADRPAWRRELVAPFARHNLFAITTTMATTMAIAMALCFATSTASADFSSGEQAVKRYQYDEAFTLLFPEAKAGHATAQLYIANMFRRGYGTKRDLALAALWYRRAAERGLPSGMYNYAVHLRDGAGVDINPAAASRWFKLAAQHGHTAAMLNLGLRMFHGRGIQLDPVMGYAWVHKAAGKGSIPAIRRRRALEKQLSVDQVGHAQKLALNLLP